MNILISHSWLKEFVKTDAGPKEIADLLSLHSASVESVKKQGNDYIYDIEVTTNRVDMMSVAGIAREIVSVLKTNRKKGELIKKLDSRIPQNWLKKNDYLDVKIDKTVCSRFSMLLFEIEIKPSPDWLRDRLDKSGIRSINNIVDITNYVMMETGQPMHAFDYEKIAGAQMNLRQSKKGESLTTLDGIKRNLAGGDIVIDDNEKLIDLCGIMGGENSAINGETKKVLIFAQTYDPIRIRKTTQTTGLRSEASTRFEKGLDSELVIPALKLSEKLLHETAGAKLLGGLIDIYENPYKPKRVSVDVSMVNTYLGIKLAVSEMEKILNSLGFSCFSDKNKITVQVPSWRGNDVNIPQDLIEEIARIYGYHNLPSRVRIGEPIQAGGDPNLPWIEKAKDVLKYWGFNEVYTSSLTAKEDLEKHGFNPQKTIKLKNPLTTEGEYLRPSIIPGVLKAVSENKPRSEEVVKIFELSKIYLPKKRQINQPVDEVLTLTGAVSDKSDKTFLQVKGIVEELFRELGIDTFSFSAKVDESCPVAKLLHPVKRLEMRVNDKACGVMGQINDVIIFDIDFDEVLKHANNNKSFQPISQYPPIIEDITFTLPEKTYVGDVMETIRKSSSLIVNLELITSYKNTRTFHIYFQHKNKNLTEKEVVEVKKKLTGEVRELF